MGEKNPYLKKEIYKKYSNEMSSVSQYNYIQHSIKRINYIGGCKNLLKAHYPSFSLNENTIMMRYKKENKDYVIKSYDKLNN